MIRASIFSVVFLASCVSVGSASKTPSFTFEAVRRLVESAPSQNQILEIYNVPEFREKEGSKERWRYLDPETQLDRVQIVFNQKKELVQVFWIPLQGEPELNIENIFKRYPKGYFKVTDKTRSSNHSLQTDTTYSSESMAILNDDASKKVQSVVWFAPATKSSDAQNPVTSR